MKDPGLKYQQWEESFLLKDVYTSFGFYSAIFSGYWRKISQGLRLITCY
jgi:hypothetical protein